MKECNDMPRSGGLRRQAMLRPEEVEAMLRLHGLGWGARRIAAEFGCSRNTVKRYVAESGWVAYGSPRRGAKLDGLEGWLEERFHRHRGNAEVVRQDLRRELSVDASLRTVERAVAPYRRLLAAEAKATVRFETPPGRQLQIDFGERRVPVADGTMRAHLFMATLGYSQWTYAKVFAQPINDTAPRGSVFGVATGSVFRCRLTRGEQSRVPTASRTSSAAPDRGTRWGAPDFMREPGMCHSPASRSISGHSAPRAVPDRTAVRTRNRKHDRVTSDDRDASVPRQSR